MSAGFVPVDARQASARRGSALHARHVVRLRPRFQTVQLKDSVPEVVFLNSHDRQQRLSYVCVDVSPQTRGSLKTRHSSSQVRQSTEGDISCEKTGTADGGRIADDRGYHALC
jgi:hypothetical protein